MQVEYFFDCSSPWTYLSFRQLQSLVSRYQAQLIWRPILVGGVFNSVNQSVYENRANPVPAKAAYYQKDLLDWASYVGVRIGSPHVFPVNSVKAMRGCFFAEAHDCLPAYAEAVFAAYWTDLKDISDDAVLGQIVRDLDLGESTFFAAISSDEVKGKLRQNTEELIDRGGFGSPTIFLDGDDMYFGNDRLPLVEKKLKGEVVLDVPVKDEGS